MARDSLFWSLLLGSVSAVIGQTYVPGTPGAAWSQSTMLIMKSKLLRLWDKPYVAAVEAKVPGKYMQDGNPTIRKIIRLGFHDCLLYPDGSGGCDGCMDWSQMGLRGSAEVIGVDGGNNGLGASIWTLEELYTNKNFPFEAPTLPAAPKDLGISRADLWAFAGMMAVEVSIELNNLACTKPEDVRIHHDQCHPRGGYADCIVTAPRAFLWSSGRKDCVPTCKSPAACPWEKPFMTSTHEVHPSSGKNGEFQHKWFKDNFNMNARETIAIMGAHTIGRFHIAISGHRYMWKTRSGQLFNNGYFRNMAAKEDWFYPSSITHFPNGSHIRQTTCHGVANSAGKAPKARWQILLNGEFSTTGGPNQWVQEKYVCPCYAPGAKGPNCCGADYFTCAPGCEQWRFVPGEDETLLSSDMGLYINFSTTPGMSAIPMDGPACPGLVVGLGQNHWDSTMCPFNTIRDPPTDKPMHQIVDDYAESSDVWLVDFFPAYEKMLSNGYAASDLTTSPMPAMHCPNYRERGAERTKHFNAGSLYDCGIAGPSLPPLPPATPSPPKPPPAPPPCTAPGVDRYGPKNIGACCAAECTEPRAADDPTCVKWPHVCVKWPTVQMCRSSCSGAVGADASPPPLPIAPPPPYPPSVNIDFGMNKVVACWGAPVTVTWQGTHDIQETALASCSSADVGAPIVSAQPPGTVMTFAADELAAEPGFTRYFKCSTHCGATNARFEVSCPANSPPPPPCTPPDIDRYGGAGGSPCCAATCTEPRPPNDPNYAKYKSIVMCRSQCAAPPQPLSPPPPSPPGYTAPSPPSCADDDAELDAFAVRMGHGRRQAGQDKLNCAIATSWCNQVPQIKTTICPLSCGQCVYPDLPVDVKTSVEVDMAFQGKDPSSRRRRQRQLLAWQSDAVPTARRKLLTVVAGDTIPTKDVPSGFWRAEWIAPLKRAVVTTLNDTDKLALRDVQMQEALKEEDELSSKPVSAFEAEIEKARGPPNTTVLPVPYPTEVPGGLSVARSITPDDFIFVANGLSVKVYSTNKDPRVAEVFLWALLSDAFKIEFFENFMNEIKAVPALQAEMELRLTQYELGLTTVPTMVTAVYLTNLPPSAPPSPSPPPPAKLHYASMKFEWNSKRDFPKPPDMDKKAYKQAKKAARKAAKKKFRKDKRKVGRIAKRQAAAGR